MKHYLESQWLAFKNQSINESESELMENHLLECDDCLNLFLSLTDELDVARADRIIPPDFSRSTLARLQGQITPQPGYMRSRNKIKRLLSYYVAASVVTLVLAGGGFFDKMANRALTLSAPSAIEARQPNNILFTWPNRLVETSSYWTQLIPRENKNLKEVIW